MMQSVVDFIRKFYHGFVVFLPEIAEALQSIYNT